jgi:oligopeptide transport system substrate-binding protein
MRARPRKTTGGWTAASPLALVFVAVFGLTAGCTRETVVQRGDREQVLHCGIGSGEPGSLDPHLASLTAEINVLSALFEGLVAEDPVDLHPVPGVAESWDISPDGLVYTFRIRENANWSDGEPLTARDFTASFQRALAPSFAAPEAALLDVIQGAEAFRRGQQVDFSQVGIVAENDRTLRIALAHPSPTFLAILAHPICYPVRLDNVAQAGPPNERGHDWAEPGHLVGDGPFTLAVWAHQREIVVVKSKTYWDAARVRLAEIHFYPFEPTAEELAFRAGQLHLTDTIPPGKIDAWRSDANGSLRLDPLLGTEFYRINVARPFLNDPRIRRALSLAVDRDAIVGKILRGGQAPATTFTPPGLAGYAPPTGDRTDLGIARKLLADAGFPGGKGLPTFELLYNTSDTHRVVAEAIQDMWRSGLGIEVRLATQEYASVLAARQTGGYDMVRSSWIADFADPSSFLEMWTKNGGNNNTGWSSEPYDALLRQAEQSKDASTRAEFFRQAETLLLAAAPIIPIYHNTHVYLIRPSVQGWHPTPLDHHPYKYVWLKG